MLFMPSRVAAAHVGDEAIPPERIPLEGRLFRDHALDESGRGRMKGITAAPLDHSYGILGRG